MRYVATQYDAPEQVLERLYHNSPLLRRAVEIVDGVHKQRDDQNFRSAATGAVYPKSPRRFLDVLDEMVDEDGDDANRDDADDDDVAKAGDRHGHHSLSAALIDHLHDRLSRRREHHGFHKSAKEQPMTSHTELVRDVVKQYGILALAKSMIQDQKSYGLDEPSFTRLATEHAQRLYPNDRPDSAFSKLYQNEESVRRACQLAKMWPMPMSLEPMVATGASGFPSTRMRSGSSPGRADDAGDVDSVGVSDAYDQLVKMAERQRRAGESASQAFERIYLDPANKHLAEAERSANRPQPTTYFPMPR
jgi:hypothetical protein